MNKNKKQSLSLLRCAKTLGRALDAPVTMGGKKVSRPSPANSDAKSTHFLIK